MTDTHQPPLPATTTPAPARGPRSAATTRAYTADWDDFHSWCSTHGHDPLPATPAAIVDYLNDKAAAGLAAKTIARRVAAIAAQHHDHDHPDPCATRQVRDTIAAIRANGPGPHSSAPLTVPELRSLIAACDTSTAIGARDAALLLCGFAGAYDRRDLVALDVTDLHFDPGQLTISGPEPVRHLTAGARPITCPIRALDHWITTARLTTGPLFRTLDRNNTPRPARLSDRAVDLIVKRVAARATIPSHRHLSARSLRAGWIHAAIAAGVPDHQIAAHTGLAPAGTTLTSYSRRAGVAPLTQPITIGL